MRRAFIASGVLGLGTALVFGAAALTATLFPNGATIPGTTNAWMRDDVRFLGKPVPAGGVFMEPPVMSNEGGGVQIDVAPAPVPSLP